MYESFQIVPDQAPVANLQIGPEKHGYNYTHQRLEPSEDDQSDVEYIFYRGCKCAIGSEVEDGTVLWLFYDPTHQHTVAVHASQDATTRSES